MAIIVQSTLVLFELALRGWEMKAAIFMCLRKSEFLNLHTQQCKESKLQVKGEKPLSKQKEFSKLSTMQKINIFWWIYSAGSGLRKESIICYECEFLYMASFPSGIQTITE